MLLPRRDQNSLMDLRPFQYRDENPIRGTAGQRCSWISSIVGLNRRGQRQADTAMGSPLGWAPGAATARIRHYSLTRARACAGMLRRVGFPQKNGAGRELIRRRFADVMRSAI